MASKAFDKIKAGLNDALAFQKGDGTRGVEHRVLVEAVDVKKVRERLSMSQPEFSAAFALPLATVRNWEQHHREPEGPARVLLHIIDKEPKAALRAIGRISAQARKTSAVVKRSARVAKKK